MRFVAVKSEESQAAAVIFRTRDLLVRQRTQLISAFRGHMGEFGVVVPQGAARVKELVTLVTDPDTEVPAAARPARAKSWCLPLSGWKLRSAAWRRRLSAGLEITRSRVG
jgi:transposase